MSAFQEHKEELEHYEQMFGRERGRLAVSLDRITNALVLAGQHGVYCTSQHNPLVPAMDLRMIHQELVHAKELVQSVMEELRKAKQQPGVKPQSSSDCSHDTSFASTPIPRNHRKAEWHFGHTRFYLPLPLRLRRT